MKSLFNFIILLISTLLLSGCASNNTTYTQQQLVTTVPKPIEGNTGVYMSPYTSDGVLAEWVNNSINRAVGSALGKTTGMLAGEALIGDNIPVVGGWIGSSVGDSIGQKIAYEAAGGEQFIKQSSDISFNDLKSLTVYLYVNYSDTEHYGNAIKATIEIYPELKNKYQQYVHSASAVAGY